MQRRQEGVSSRFVAAPVLCLIILSAAWQPPLWSGHRPQWVATREGAGAMSRGEGELDAGRYRQPDPAGLEPAPNRYEYAASQPLTAADPSGLYLSFLHRRMTRLGADWAGLDPATANELAELVVGADFLEGSQEKNSATWHAMCPHGQPKDLCAKDYEEYIERHVQDCSSLNGLARVLHAIQDSHALGHRGMPGYINWYHMPLKHLIGDTFPGPGEYSSVIKATKDTILRWKERCSCRRSQ